MKNLINTLFFTLTLTALSTPITWTEQNEAALEQKTLSFAKKLPSQIVLIGRTGLTTTRVATVVSHDGHILSPYLPSIDKQDVPYLLYKADGSRIPLSTIAEKPRRSLALLKLEKNNLSLTPTRVSALSNHTVMIPTCAPIASLGESPGIFIDHLDFPPLQDASVFRLDNVFYSPGTPIFDLSGSLIGTTLKTRAENTPAVLITRVLREFPELNEILPDLSESDLPTLPLAPAQDSEDDDEIQSSPITEARASYLRETYPSPLPCAHIFNEGAQATHSVIGTIVREDGMILTKASELGPELRVNVGGENYVGIILATDEASDLALVGIAANGLPVVTWTDQVPRPGTHLISPILLQESSEEMLIEPSCVTGTFSHILKTQTPTVHSTSQVTSLGVTTEQRDNGLTIAAIQKESSASEAGLSLGDVIENINGTTIKRRSDLTTFLNNQQVGDEVHLLVRNSAGSHKTKITLSAPHLIPPTTGMNVPDIAMIPSVRRSPFPDVLVHTTPLNAWDCGSPIFDRQGHALGLNIAAVSSARSFALRPSDIRKILKKLLAETRAF